MLQEITSGGPLLDDKGELLQSGWARRPYLDCNLENVSFLRSLLIKRWDYYAVTTPECFFSVTLAHLGYVGTVFAYMLDFESLDLHEETLVVPFGRGIRLSRNAEAGDSRFDNGRVRVDFHAEEGTRRVGLSWPAFSHGEGISADFVLYCGPRHESVVTATPMRGKRFFYTRKANCMPASGWITRGDRRVELSLDRSLGTLDWGRGIWEYRTSWIWASASVLLDESRTVGLNLGAGFGGESAPDNAFTLDGRVHKLNEVTIERDPHDRMATWRMASPDGRLELEFAPFKERVARTNLVLVRSEVHQIFGRYSGRLRTDDDQLVSLPGAIGFIEEHAARW